jgi:pimeloyl-ACP methyl ester carboxylesterase
MLGARRLIRLGLLASLVAVAAACGTPPPQQGTPDKPPLPAQVTLPIVFIHGFAGSAQQYQSQAIRFAMNGYPADRIRAYEHDGAGLDIAGYVAGADALIDQVRAEYKVSQVFLVGHSRGTSVSSQYLSDATRARKIAKYVSLDGRGCDAATAANVPCIAPSQANLPGQKHVEVATSAECFVRQYQFLIGGAPELVDIVPQPGPVRIMGRAVNFPANTGAAGAKLEIYEVDGETGHRVSRRPVASYTIGEDGFFGPVELDPNKYYEKVLDRGEGSYQHFYAQRYIRNTAFVRLLTGGTDSGSSVNTNRSDKHSAVIALRMREWIGENDKLEISTTSESGGEKEAVDAMTAAVGSNRIAVYLHDAAASPGDSTLAPLPYFPTQPFQTGVDVFMPAADPPDGTITLKNIPRGDTERPQVINVPNWASSEHIIMTMFSDYAQD